MAAFGSDASKIALYSGLSCSGMRIVALVPLKLTVMDVPASTSPTDLFVNRSAFVTSSLDVSGPLVEVSLSPAFKCSESSTSELE